MVIGIMLAFVLASPQTFKKAGDDAYLALRAFEAVELQAFHTRPPAPALAWPNDEQHRQIVAKCAILNENVHDSLILRFDLIKMPMSPQANSLLINQHQAVQQLDSYVDSTAPADARKLMAKVRQAFEKLFSLFPGSDREDEHPPARKRP
jgi:hypothetical protein